MNENDHTELKRLLRKIDSAIKNREDITLLESLLACELINSRLLIPAVVEDKGVRFNVITAKKDVLIPLFTDYEESQKFDTSITALRKPFRAILQLIDVDVDGIAINPFGENCIIKNEYLHKYFEVNNED